jgi:hypothetical protein
MILAVGGRLLCADKSGFLSQKNQERKLFPGKEEKNCTTRWRPTRGRAARGKMHHTVVPYTGRRPQEDAPRGGAMGPGVGPHRVR